MNGTILLTEDDRDISDLIKVYLKGFYRSEEDVRKARKWRANSYLLKPMDKSTLLRRMRPFLDA